ncbi:MAG: SRPBCC domain-containing protein [Thermoanaerobaculia bacterium]|nr:SRPBCC domain-containing protein [Thermoanaerobaculia bacterium]
MIRWPERYDPARAPVHVSNEIDISALPEAVWAWLVRAPLWPSWYPNSEDVVVDGGASELALGVTFTWRTFGVAIRSTVLEFEPFERIAWNAFGLGVEAYHAWEVTPAPAGSHVLTEETQSGWAARLGSIVFPNRMSKLHQIWLERLAEKAKGGPPPRS